jgi:1-aminocyclopropane-1-carboxylate deaminase
MFEFPIHSPVEQITYDVPDGYSLFIKRDDLIDPLISGNKWRKLKFTLQEAHKQGKTTLVSFGGAYSNHLLALASAAAKFQLKSIAFVRGDEEQTENTMMIISRMMGMQFIRVSRDEYRDKPALFKKYFEKDDTAFFVDEGGMSAEGSLGCEEIIDELTDTYTDIFLAAGTGCTTAGIINVINKKQLHTHVHSVVVHRGVDEVTDNVNRLSYFVSRNSSLEILPVNIPIAIGNQSPVTIHQSPMRYAQHSPELLQFCITFQQNTGIMLDPIYTGKAMMKCYEWMKGNPDGSGKILFIHTGGLLGNLGKLDAFLPYLPR